MTYHKIGRSLRLALRPLTFYLKLPRQVSVKLWIMEGQELNSRESISVLCAGSDQERSYLAGMVFGRSYRQEYLGRVWLWNIRRITENMGRECSMIFAKVHAPQRRLLGADGWFYIPVWVSGMIDLPLDSTLTRKNTVKSDLRNIRNHNLGFEITRDAQHFNDFYHNMYVPYITMTHGNGAFVMPYEEMKARFKECELLLIKAQQEYIAGVLIVYSQAPPRLWSLGIRDGNTEYLKHGATVALYHFALKYLEGKGFQKIGFGSSRAFMRDGVLRYKKKWGHRIVGTSSTMFALKVFSLTTATRSFLLNNPFIFDNCGSSCGAVFVDAEEMPSPQELEQIDKDYFYPGLSELRVYLLRSNYLPDPNAVPTELSERITLYSAQDIAK